MGNDLPDALNRAAFGSRSGWAAVAWRRTPDGTVQRGRLQVLCGVMSFVVDRRVVWSTLSSDVDAVWTDQVVADNRRWIPKRALVIHCGDNTESFMVFDASRRAHVLAERLDVQRRADR